MANEPRLLHVFPGFGPAGTQLRMVSIINALGKSFAHHIVSLDGNTEAANAFAGVDVSVEGPPAESSTPRPLVFRALVRSLGPAVALTYNWGAIDATLGARLAGVCPVIHNECGLGVDEAHALIRRRVWARRLILNSVHRTVVTSQNMLRIARRDFKLPPRKVQLIQTGVDVTRYLPASSGAPSDRFGAPEDGLLIGFLGGLRPEKNLAMLLRAYRAATLPNSRLVLAGEGPCRGELEQLAAELKIADRVIFAGHQAEPARFLRALDLFAMSSVTEQVSNAQLEAMATGLPVLCTDAGDSRELLGEHTQACVVLPNDQTAYASALQNLAADPGLRASLGAVNRERAVKYYSKDQMVEQYAELYRHAIAPPHQGRRRAAKDSHESCTRLESGN